jgi:hypothetical protein
MFYVVEISAGMPMTRHLVDSSFELWRSQAPKCRRFQSQHIGVVLLH